MNAVTVTTSPSLALIKYWGKSDVENNLPATSSFAVTLEGLYTTTTVSLAQNQDQVFINGKESNMDRFQAFFQFLKKKITTDACFLAESRVNFPVAAGLASSSSGFAALAWACCRLINPEVPLETISECARLGSASAARSVYGGFTTLRKGSIYAEPLDLNWPELRVIIAIVSDSAKPVSSRKAMEAARATSPYYAAWLSQSDQLYKSSLEAAQAKDLSQLGPLMRQSYLSMFSTMLTSAPPIIYWKPESIALIRFCETLRSEGLQLFETMDAGPQVKMVCLEQDLNDILNRLKEEHPSIQYLVSSPGGAPKC
jgi:diphosphomevalonate decarboxylase